MLDALNQLNTLGNQQLHDPELDARIIQYEMAFRMQASVPNLMDLSDEPDHILALYGQEGLKGTRGGDGSFASNVFWPDGSRNGAFVLFNFITAVGTTTVV